MISYDEALEIVEEFNIKSGLRDFCTNRCKGACCWDCKDRCDRYEERRLPCSTFFCSTIMLMILPDVDDRRKYKKIHRATVSHMRRCTGASSVYYRHPSKEEFSRIKHTEMPDLIKGIKSFDTKRIRDILDKITPEQIKFIQNREHIIAKETLDKRTRARLRKAN